MELKNLLVDRTEKTPQIDFNHYTGDLILSGRSIPENAANLYEGALNWATLYAEHPRSTTNLRLNLEYYNTASTIWLAKIVKALCNTKESESTLIIHLYFNIEEFDSMDTDDLKDTLVPITELIGNTNVSLGIKIYGTEDNGEILKESMVLI